jgi:hypothetical protein
MSLDKIKEFTDELSKDPEKLKNFLRRVMGPNRRTVTGVEYDNIWTLLQLTEPVRQSNNQRTWTDEYIIGNKRYDVTYGLTDIPEIEEVEQDENS